MTEQIIDELRALGVKLWADNGRLRFRAPRDVLTEEHKATLTANKAVILASLSRDEKAISHDARGRHEPFPLTDVQTAYLLGRQDSFGYGGVACHGYLEVACPGIDADAVERAWNTLIVRHDMLRAVVEPDGYQHVLAQVPTFRVGRSDDPAAVRTELGHRVYETTRWPLHDLHVTPGRLHISMDSLIADWASAGILLGELDTLLADPGAELPPLEITFRDYLLAERALRDTDRYGRDRDYWLARVDDLPAAPDLPRKPGDSTGPVRFQRHHATLGAGPWAALRERAGQRGLTPSNVVLAGYADVLRRWSRRPRFGLNLTLLDRRPRHPQVDGLVGDFTSVTLLAVEPAAGQAFHERARGLAEQLFTDLDHRLFSGVEVGREIARRRGRDAALMPVVFTSGIGLGSADRPAGNGITQTPQVFLDCQVTDDAGGLAISWDVRQGIFPDGLVADMFTAFVELLNALADGDEAWQRTGPVPLPAWQVAERVAVNDTAAPLPDALLHQDFFVRAAREPAAVALTGPAGTVTYGELARHAGAVARALGGKELGRVAVVMDKGPEQLAAVLGILLAGGAYLPVDTTQPALRRARLLASAGVRIVLSQSWVDRPDGVEIIDVDTLEPSARIPAPEPGNPDAPAYVIYTSGSTGEPKGAVITHRSALNTVEDVTRRFGVTAGDRVLGLAQLGFDLSVYDIFGPLSIGASLVLPDAGRPADPSHWADLIAEHGVTLWNSVPAQLQMLANYLESEPRPIPSLRLALLSGDWIPVTLPGRIATLSNAELIGLGGATEAAIWSICHPIDRVDPEWTSIPYGKPLANQGFRVLDEFFHDCPVWTPGELCITGAGLALGYFGDEELTASRFPAHPHDGTRLYRTGDLGRYLPGGAIEFLGREDDQVKIRGHRIELGEIEAALLAHENVGAAAVVVTGERHGERALLGFAEPARLAGPVEVPQRLVEAVHRFVDHQVAGITTKQVAAHVRDLHEAALLSMLTALTERGAFETARDTAGILAAARIHERHHWLVRRWLVLLTAAGKLTVDGTYTRVADAGAELVEQAWRRVGQGLATPEFLRYHQVHVEHIDALLDGVQSPFELLFPEGRLDTARAIYRDDTITRYLNNGAAALLNRLAATSDRPLRVLEVGAGTGAATSAVLPMLEGFDIDYLYTDLTPFFLTPAREEFPRARFGLFDLDQDFRAQGLAANSFDVVLGAGVLSSTRDPGAAIAAATELLAPGGWLVFTEPTQEHPHILLTQGFMMEPAGGDHRAGATPLLSTADWLGLVDADVVLPADDHPQAAQGMRLFATRVKTDRRPVSADDLTAFLAERLPAHMVPAHIQVVDGLPLTGNGKLDRRTLAGWRPAPAADGIEAEHGTPDELDGRLSALWASALGVPRIGRDDNFYDRGADSLVLARVAGRLREEIPEAEPFTYDTLLRQMLNEPTVSALAGALRRQQPSATPVDGDTATGDTATGNALLVSFGGGDDGPARVLFHAALGTLDYFQSLGKALAAQALGPVIGVAVADQEAYCAIEPKRLIGRVADDYTDRLLAAGHTRFQLIGYCLGGLLATEVARRLLERGVPVEDLTLVDSIPMFLETGEELAFEAIFVPNLNLDPVTAVFGPDVDGADVYRAIEKLMIEHDRAVPAGAMAALTGDPGLEAVAAAVRARHEVDQDTRLAQYARAASERAGIPVDPELVPALFRVCRHSMRAARYDPEPYAGDMTFLRATEQRSFGVTAGVGHLAAPFWKRTCLGEFTVIDVPGNHFSVIEPPNLDVVVGRLGAAITGGANA